MTISPTDTLIISKPCPACHGVGYIVTNCDGISLSLCRVCHGDKSINIEFSILELADALHRLIAPPVCLDDIDYGEAERAEIEAMVEEGQHTDTTPCPECDGKGERIKTGYLYIQETCPVCRGNGYIPSTANPAEIEDRQPIEFDDVMPSRWAV